MFTQRMTKAAITLAYCSLFFFVSGCEFGTIGHKVDGVVQSNSGFLSVWQANTPADLIGIDPSVHLHGQFHRPLDAFKGGAPKTLRFLVRSFRDDGSTISPGVAVKFTLVSSDESKHTYQSQKPILLIENPALEGEGPEVNAIASGDGMYTRIVWPALESRADR